MTYTSDLTLEEQASHREFIRLYEEGFARGDYDWLAGSFENPYLARLEEVPGHPIRAAGWEAGMDKHFMKAASDFDQIVAFWRNKKGSTFTLDSDA